MIDTKLYEKINTMLEEKNELIKQYKLIEKDIEEVEEEIDSIYMQIKELPSTHNNVDRLYEEIEELNIELDQLKLRHEIHNDILGCTEYEIEHLMSIGKQGN